jgi:hypothetical protein
MEWLPRIGATTLSSCAKSRRTSPSDSLPMRSGARKSQNRKTSFGGACLTVILRMLAWLALLSVSVGCMRDVSDDVL